MNEAVRGFEMVRSVGPLARGRQAKCVHSLSSFRCRHRDGPARRADEGQSPDPARCARRIVHPTRVPRITNEHALDLLETLAPTDLPLGLHNEDQEIIKARIARHIAGFSNEEILNAQTPPSTSRRMADRTQIVAVDLSGRGGNSGTADAAAGLLFRRQQPSERRRPVRCRISQ
jgi:hypothetical protein